MRGLDAVVWGDVATWVQAVATIAAVAAAIWAGRWAKAAYNSDQENLKIAREALGVERQRDLGREQEVRRAQAEKVAGRWENTPGDEYMNTFSLILQNVSDQPVYGIRVDLVEGNRVQPDLYCPPVLAPAPNGSVVAAHACDVSYPRLILHFTDFRGVRWERGADGILVEPPA